MADYTIMSDVGAYIVELLRNKLCPHPLPSPDEIQSICPREQKNDYTLGLYLYDIEEENDTSYAPLLEAQRAKRQRPSKPYRLYYMVFLNSASHKELKEADIQNILGRTAQIINDYNAILPNQLQTQLEIPEPAIVLSQMKLSLEEKVKVWQVIHRDYQVSLFYAASPVFLSSGIVADSSKVKVKEVKVNMSVAGEERS